MDIVIASLRRTHEEDVLLVTLVSGGQQVEYCYRPDDPFGLSPAIKKWLEDNEGQYTIEPNAPA
ncbi:hypothetical protein [Sinorhizobium fredii]|uniref:hypothetical protein n=1 Tax=Rhizobium fredii TaxID=380 RepID=UPI0004B57A06|nr:hypothetical protein [Sinorhizobium fredii]AWM23452.1 hypothetical protein AOX55_0000167 [Sinorhizobium fredii CCBAU 25509]